jgi:hypothetical protein
MLELSKIEKALKQINRGQVKIWFQIPHYFNFHINIGLAFSMLIAYLQGGFSIENFNNILDEYRSHVLDSVEEFIFFTRNNVLNNTIRNILAIAWILDYASNGSTSFSSLIGGGNINAIRVHNISYRITTSSDSHYTDDVSRLCPEFNEKYITQYLNFVIGSMLNKTTSYRMHSGARVLDDEHLIMHIKNGSDIIFGSLLRSLFDRDIPAFTIEKRPGELCICPQIRIAYEASHLEISGPWRRVFEIEKSIDKKNDISIIYSSNSMGGEVGGARLRLPEEYQATPKFMLKKNLFEETDDSQVIVAHPIAKTDQGISEFYIGIEKHKKYSVRIRNISDKIVVKHIISERIFSRLVFLLSVKLTSDDGWVDKQEVYPYRKDQAISECRSKIEPYDKLLLNELKKVKLDIDNKAIIIDAKIKHFESKHIRDVVMKLNEFHDKKKYLLKNTANKNIGISEVENTQNLLIDLAKQVKIIMPIDEDMKIFKLHDSLRSFLEHTFLVKRALEMRNLKYQTKKWQREKWHWILRNLLDIFDSCGSLLPGSLIKREDWDLYHQIKTELGINR